MNDREEEIRKRLEAAWPPPEPPAGLLEELKQQIPDSFAYGARHQRRALWRSAAAWKVAASVVVVAGAAYIALRVGTPQKSVFPEGDVAMSRQAPQQIAAPTSAPAEVAAPPSRVMSEGGVSQAAPELAKSAPARDAAAGNESESKREKKALADAPAPPPPAAKAAEADAVRDNRFEAQTAAAPQPVEGGVVGGAVGGVSAAVEEGKEATAQRSAPAPSLQSKGPRLVRAAPGTGSPKLMSSPGVEYPEKARRARVDGTVMIEATIDDRGLVQNARVIEGLPMGLSEAALDAVIRSRFEPMRADGKPVWVIREVAVRFFEDGRACVECED